MKKKYIALAVVTTVILSGIAWAYYLFQKPHGDVGGVSPAFRVKAADLYSAFKTNESTANMNYNGKVIEVTGTVTAVEATDSTASLLFETGDPAGSVVCGFLFTRKHKPTLPGKATTISVKGRCVGFLQDVTLTDCVLQ
jgi:hypothetical protein